MNHFKCSFLLWFNGNSVSEIRLYWNLQQFPIGTVSCLSVPSIVAKGFNGEEVEKISNKNIKDLHEITGCIANGKMLTKWYLSDGHKFW